MPEISMMYEARSFDGEKLDNLLKETNDIFEEVAKEFGAKVENGVKKGYAGFKLDENLEIINHLKKACENINLKCELKSSGGGSDANVYNAKGYVAVNLAVGMTKVHTTEEYIEIDDLVEMSKLTLEIVKELAKC